MKDAASPSPGTTLAHRTLLCNQELDIDRKIALLTILLVCQTSPVQLSLTRRSKRLSSLRTERLHPPLLYPVNSGITPVEWDTAFRDKRFRTLKHIWFNHAVSALPDWWKSLMAHTRLGGIEPQSVPV